MGWKQALRQMEASSRRAERDRERKERARSRELQRLQKLQEVESASIEVEEHEDFIESLKTLHTVCGADIRWDSWASASEPSPPSAVNSAGLKAKAAVDSYRPNFFDRLFRQETRRKEKLKADHLRAIEADRVTNESNAAAYVETLADWKENQELAKRILSKDLSAYDEALNESGAFDEFETIGTTISFQPIDGITAMCSLDVHDREVVPVEIKTQLKSGKLSVKKMLVGARNKLYQDYVASASLRTARELFALLPLERIIVTARAEMLNSKTGYVENQPILSVLFMRTTLNSLNLDSIDPSDSIGNFVHRMDFRPTQGFKRIEEMQESDLPELS